MRLDPERSPGHWWVLVCLVCLAGCGGIAGCGGETSDPDDRREARVELGRHLFYDVRLSINEKRSCGLCHEQAKGFTDGFVRAVGATQEVHPRNTLSLANVGERTSLTWLRDAPDELEAQLLVPLLGTHPVEMGMGGQEELLIQRIKADPLYLDLFAQSFPRDSAAFSLENVAVAIAAFEETLVSRDSPYDRHLAGDMAAMGPAAVRGMELFFGERVGCARCHGGQDLDSPTDEDGRVLSRHAFFNNGLYDIDSAGSYPPGGEGLFAETGVAADMGRFRTPSLRNVEVTGPYMHDGSSGSLEAILDAYARGGRETRTGPFVGDGAENPFKDPLVAPFEMSVTERDDLLAFLLALTDRSFLEDPALGDPFAEE